MVALTLSKSAGREHPSHLSCNPCSATAHWLLHTLGMTLNANCEQLCLWLHHLLTACARKGKNHLPVCPVRSLLQPQKILSEQ